MSGISVNATGKVYINEHHHHSHARWLAAAAVAVGETHVADRIGPTAQTAFHLDAGNDTWGAWVQVLGSTDTPVAPHSLFFDPHYIFVTASERTTPYILQFGHGASGAIALTDDEVTDFIYNSTGAGAVADRSAVEVHTDRHAKGTKVWARCFCPGQNTGTIDFYLGLHEYLT